MPPPPDSRSGIARPTAIAAAIAAAVAFAATASGCALVKPVLPWEKGVLARPEMTFEADKLDAAFAEHIYSSKEASSGGSGVGGGGCGCN